MVYLIVDKDLEGQEKIKYYKCFLQELYHDDVECIIEDNRVITPLGLEGKALEKRGKEIRKKLPDAKAVYLCREGEVIVLKDSL